MTLSSFGKRGDGKDTFTLSRMTFKSKLSIVGKYSICSLDVKSKTILELEIVYTEREREIGILKCPPIRRFSASSNASYCIKVCLSLMKHMYFVT